jgi:hypothetical protein
MPLLRYGVSTPYAGNLLHVQDAKDISLPRWAYLTFVEIACLDLVF